MERMTGLDANFLYNETPSEHMHTLKLAVLDPPEGGPVPVEAMREEIARRMGSWPAFSRRVVRVPLDLHHPLWVEAGPIDVDAHVHVARIPEPGDDAAMDAVVAEIAGTPLDRSRPLWEVWLLEGRADGRIAALAKIHHCVADGLAANALLGAIMTTGPGPFPGEPAVDHPGPPPCGPPPAEPVPTGGRLLAGALSDLARDARRLPTAVRETRVRMSARRAAADRIVEEGGEAPPRPILDTPATPMNRAVTPRRAAATGTLPLAPLLAAKRAAGATLNDVLLTLAGGALTEVLDCRADTLASRAASPSPGPARRRGNRTTSLTASVPVASEHPAPGAPPRLSGNKVSNLFVSLHTEIADPLERLRAVHRSMDSAKALHDAVGADVMETWLAYTPPRPYAWAMRGYSGLHVADHHRAPVNVIVSCVPGPREPLWVAGARLAGFWSAGPVLEGIAVNITAWSYCDNLDVMVTSCARALPEPAAVVEAMADAMAALEAACTGSP